MRYTLKVFTLLTLSVFLQAGSVEIVGVTQYSLTTKGISYSITSQKRIIKPPKKVSILTISKKQEYISNSAYYTNGTFKNKNSTIKFKKAYWLEGTFYMQECAGEMPHYSFVAKKVSYKKSGLYNFKNIRYKQNGVRYIKHDYSVKF